MRWETMWDLTKEHDINVGVFVGVQGDNDVSCDGRLTKPFFIVESSLVELSFMPEQFHSLSNFPIIPNNAK
jgi:hypothetical protein